jgi:hypothetical protein
MAQVRAARTGEQARSEGAPPDEESARVWREALAEPGFKERLEAAEKEMAAGQHARWSDIRDRR